jgi:hypothetical protein
MNLIIIIIINNNNNNIMSEINKSNNDCVDSKVINIHSEYIDKRIIDIKKNNKWNSKLINTLHDDFIKDYSDNVFTNLIKNTFTTTYIKKFKCECDEPAKERCHGIGEERPILIKRELEKVWSDTSKEITMKEIIIAFLEEHKNTKFTFKCHNCHINEKNIK